jgi:Nucleotidyl transferase AbiEii toxin, Type IV TA system
VVDKVKNLAASVRQRLLNVAKQRRDEFDLILARYALERLLYRLSVSPHGEGFLLKGALLFAVWGVDDHRPTRDADLLGSGDSDPAALTALFREVCAVPCEDGISFDPDSVAAAPIAEDKIYPGVRVTLRAKLAGARIPVQIDIGFGDAVTPAPERVDYPVLLDAPAPKLRAYPVATVVAEKFHAMTVLGMGNSRMKDFHDLRVIASRFEIETGLLAGAIAATFERRKTSLPGDAPVALCAEFAADKAKLAQWAAFLRRNRLDGRHHSLGECQAAISKLVLPALKIARDRQQ